MTRQALPFALLLAACGDVATGHSLGAPIYVMQAEMQGSEIGEPEGEHRAIFGWASLGDGDYYDCLESTNVLFCGRRTQQDTKLVLSHTEVRTRFPSGLEIPFYAFPKREDLLDRQGAVLAVGGMAIYDDRNLNGELDPIAPDDPAPIDHVVAESIFGALERQEVPATLAIFREGPLHPAWNALRDLWDCPPPPPGFSVGRLDKDLKCTVSRTEALLVTASDDDATARARCGGGIGRINLAFRSQEPMMPPPESAVSTCKQGRLVFYEDHGNFCDQFDFTVYALKGCTGARCWDLREDPPAWWPCPTNL